MWISYFTSSETHRGPELCQERLIPHSDLKVLAAPTGINYHMNQPSTRPVLADVSMKNKPFLRSRRNAPTKPETQSDSPLCWICKCLSNIVKPLMLQSFSKQNFSMLKTNDPNSHSPVGSHPCTTLPGCSTRSCLANQAPSSKLTSRRSKSHLLPMSMITIFLENQDRRCGIYNLHA